MVKEITSTNSTKVAAQPVTPVFIPVETSVAKADVQIEQTRFNYNTLLNKPKINGITIIGDKSGADYGLTNISVFNKEVLERIEADEDLQRQIDDIEIRADVIDVIFKDTDLPNYPTDHLTKDDVIIVLDDTSHEDYLSYYRWTVTEESSSWVYIASDESGYTKAQIDALLKAITDRLDTAEDNIEQLQINVENLNTGLTNEINRATGEEQRIEGKVDAETQTRGEEIERVEGLINTESQTRGEEIERVEGLVSAEETRATGEEQRIEARFDDYRTSSDQDIIDTGIKNRVKSLEDTRDTFGDIITHNASEFATAEQGAKADTAVQNLGDLGITVSATEINYLDNVTSNIQTQLNNKQPTINDLDTIRSNATAGKSASDTIATYGDVVTHYVSEFATSEQGAKADSALQETDVINNVTSTATNKPLSANMGKELNDRIDNIESRGRFLSQWNSVTGLPTTNPSTVLPYDYKSGDYYTVSVVGETNYRPTGTSYTGTASRVVETEEVAVDDTYLFDGEKWLLQINHGKTVSFTNLAGSPYDNSNLSDALNSKVTGNNAITGATHTKITYDSKGLVTGGSDLTTGDIPNLTLSKITDVTASATEVNYVKGVTSSIQTQLNSKLPNTTKYGKGIDYNSSNSTLTLKDQDGNTLDTTTISIPDSATWGNITGTLSNQTDLQQALDNKVEYAMKVIDYRD